MAKIVVVGAGVAGLAASYLTAKAGFETTVLEKKPAPGANSPGGGVCHTRILQRLIGECHTELALERRLTQRRVGIIEDDTEIAMELSLPDTDLFSVLGPEFERSFAAVCRKMGARILYGKHVVDIQPGKTPVGQAAREAGSRRANGGDVLRRPHRIESTHHGHALACDDGSSYEADGIVLAEGLVSEIARREGFRARPCERHLAITAGEVLGVPANRLADRFNLAPSEGFAADYVWIELHGFRGRGFLYTNKDSLCVGVTVPLPEIERGATARLLLEAFKALRPVRRLIEGSERIDAWERTHLWSQPCRPLPVGREAILLAGDAGGYSAGKSSAGHFERAVFSGSAAAEALVESWRLGSIEFAEVAYQGRLSRDGMLRREKHWPLPSGEIVKAITRSLRSKLTTPGRSLARVLAREARTVRAARIVQELLEWTRARW